ncbi:MAG: VCBS repeat-containing protein, partial [Candidatus Omnitrophica bacterium]|nr:VCBS repeat-containing protein [Candidatus Omnitrophota bacterium]
GTPQWTQLHTLSPELMVTGDFDGDGQDEVILDYGEFGIHVWDSNGTPQWTQLHTLSPELMVTGDFDGDNQDEAILDYGEFGIHVWDNEDGFSQIVFEL